MTYSTYIPKCRLVSLGKVLSRSQNITRVNQVLYFLFGSLGPNYKPDQSIPDLPQYLKRLAREIEPPMFEGINNYIDPPYKEKCQFFLTILWSILGIKQCHTCTSSFQTTKADIRNQQSDPTLLPPGTYMVRWNWAKINFYSVATT